MSINVKRDCQDAFYRYKMPRLIAKVEGKGNGIKTVIPNMADIARSLGRPPTYPTKFFGCELGAQTQFDHKNDRYIVNGSHDAAKLQDLLFTFIDKFVLCENCENPETVLKVNTKKGIINSSCKACGHNYNLDMRHKLTTFIVKNPPEQDLKAAGTSLTERKEKRSKRREQEQQEQGSTGNDESGMGNNGDDDFGDDDDAEWSTDVSKEAVKQRMKELSLGVKGLAMDDDMEKSETERINILHNYIMKKLPAGKTLDIADEKAILIEAERLEIVTKAPMLLCEIVLCELLPDDKVIAQIKKFKRLFLRFTHENQKAQKYLMGGIEKTIEAKKEELLPKVPAILKTFYDEDILEEEVLLEWGKKVSKKYISKELSEQIHKRAESFLTWLKTAEEESEEDSDEDVQLEFDERAKISTIKEKIDEAPATNGSKNGKESSKEPDSIDDDEEEEDVDIDDI